MGEMSGLLRSITEHAGGEAPEFMVVGVDDYCSLIESAASNPWELRRMLRTAVPGWSASRRTASWRHLNVPRRRIIRRFRPNSGPPGSRNRFWTFLR
jgi:hypothetical protein